MRLKQHEKPSGERMQRGERRRDFVGVVPEIVDHGDAGGFPDQFEAALEAGKACDRSNRRAERHPRRARRAEGGKRIGHIVAAWHRELHRVRRTIGHEVERDRKRIGAQIARAQVGLLFDREGHEPRRVQRRRQRRRLVIADVEHDCLGLGREVAEQSAQFLNRFVVEADIVEHRDLRVI